MERLFQYRFAFGEGLEGPQLRQPVHRRDERDHRQTSRRRCASPAGCWRCAGRCCPPPWTHVILRAEYDDGSRVTGESRDSLQRARGSAASTWLPPRPGALPEAIEAILEADCIVLGPRQPVHQHPAQPAGRRHRRGPHGVPRHASLRLQRGDPARRDRRLHRVGPRQGPDRPRRRRPDRLRGRQRRAGAGRGGGRATRKRAPFPSRWTGRSWRLSGCSWWWVT